MNNIELVVKISEEDFEIMKHNITVDNPLCPLSQEKIVTIIANGIPLPKNTKERKPCKSCKYYGSYNEACDACNPKYNDLWREKEQNKSNSAVDCILRASAKKAIVDHQYSNSFCEEHNIDHSINTGMALIALSDLPPATSIRPKGHWIEKGEDWVCSCCNEPVCEIYDGEPWEYFCPNCGADMREVEE